MTPGFALSLSIDGIVLLSRGAGGWHVAGRVSLDDPDLPRALSDLRDRAIELEDPAFRTKLIIPNDQIRYLTVDTGHVATADRIEQVRNALDGATPYPVDALVYDICVDGPMTHVAAVARETLDEAEAFAVEHQFNPVSFVAAPDDAAFLGEPFFGPTRFSEKALTSGERVEADGVAVVVIGDVDEADAEDTPPVTEATGGEAAWVPDAPAAEAREPRKAEPAARFDTVPAVEKTEPEDTPAPGFSSRRKSQIPVFKEPAGSTISPRIADDEEETPQPAALSASFEHPDLPEDAPDAEAEPPPTWAARFLSRRSDSAAPVEDEEPATAATSAIAARKMDVAEPPKRPVSKPPAADVAVLENEDERNRMTIFGMREQEESKGTPRHLGLILTAILLLFLAGVAAWAAVFLDEEVAALFKRDDPVVTSPLPETALPEPEIVDLQVEEPQIVSLDPDTTGLTDTDTAVLDALRPEPEPEVTEPELTLPAPVDVEAIYAVTGIWQKAPEAPVEPGLIGLDDLYITSIDGAVDARDAIALPAPELFDTDQTLAQISSPAAPDLEFAFDADGRVIPTPEGALSPDGFTVVLGRPPVVPPATPERPDVVEDVETAAVELPNTRPRSRPDDLIEQSERSQLGGLTLSELSGVRPQARPQVEKSADEADETPTAQAVQASITPRLRPVNMAQLVAAARNARARASQTQAAAASTAAIATAPQAASVPEATVAPRVPSSASVSRAATVNNAINLRRVNLIGVYGTSANRRALVRLPNGRYRKVEVGDRLDGGRISAIGESELRYQKGGRNLVLRIPSG